jgi:hypothetical protein
MTNTMKLPAGTVPANIRSLTQTQRSAAIRSLLRAAGIKDARVKNATGSMCYWTKVYVAPGTEVRAIESLIVAAFPDLADRSDLMTDHYDFMFTVGVRHDMEAAVVPPAPSASEIQTTYEEAMARS